MLILPARHAISASIEEDGNLCIVSDPSHDGHNCEPQFVTIDRDDIENFLLALNDIWKESK